ncbi:MAG: S8 family peptidase [Elusimicrobiota bacterium]
MRSLLILVFSLAAVGQAWAGGSRLIVGFHKHASAEQRDAVLDKFGMKAIEELDILNAKVVEAPGGEFRPAAVQLMAEPSVFYVEEDFHTNWLVGAGASFQQMPLPSLGAIMRQLPEFEKKDATEGEMPWGITRVNAEAAWPHTQGENVRVAVIDTGIDYNHPDLAANYAGGHNAIDSSKEPFDDHSHGTHVAGTIGAVADGKGVVGVAPKAKLYAVKVLDKNGSGFLTSIIKGIVWCGRNEMQIANMSLGSPMGSIFMRMAVMYSKSKGVVMVAAAGNSGGRVSYPGGYSETIAVSASDANDRIAEFSSRGEQVDFIAPGVDVKSTLPGGGYGRYSGTSMASPHVAGLAALAVTQGAVGFDAVKAALKSAAQPLDELKPTEQGQGLINAGLLIRN